MLSRRILSRNDAAIIGKIFARGRNAGPANEQGMAPDVSGSAALKPDDYTVRLLKLIPADVIAVFITIDGAIRSAQGKISYIAYWIIFIVLLLGCYFLVMKQSSSPGLPKPYRQAVLSAVSFAVWVFAIGGPFQYTPHLNYEPIYGTILLPLYTFFVPLFVVDKN